MTHIVLKLYQSTTKRIFLRIRFEIVSGIQRPARAVKRKTRAIAEFMPEARRKKRDPKPLTQQVVIFDFYCATV